MLPSKARADDAADQHGTGRAKRQSGPRLADLTHRLHDGKVPTTTGLVSDTCCALGDLVEAQRFLVQRLRKSMFSGGFLFWGKVSRAILAQHLRFKCL